ncbi:MAG: c-type cytochrome [Anaerolineales bacterium]|jgi:mono/diheme cytochrome c family protein
MKRKKNASGSGWLEYLIGIGATLILASAIFWFAWREPERIASAQETQLQSDLDEAMTLYAENCAVCHGLAGEGIGVTPALNSQPLQESDYASLSKIISRGLFNTAMPAWGKEDAGPLSDYQIGELVSLIQYGDWQETQDRVVNLGLAPTVPFTSSPDEEILASLANEPGGELLVQGVRVYAEQCVACHGPDGAGTALAPALNDPQIAAKDRTELERTILNGIPGTLMAGWERSLNEADLEAVVALITQWEQVPSGVIPAPDRPIPVTEQSLALGAEIYANSCSSCHGPEGQGTRRAPALNVQEFLTNTSDAAIQQIVTLGVPGTAMPAWGDRLTEVDTQALVGFIRSWEPTAPEVAEPARGGGSPWWQTGATSGAGGAVGGPPWMRNVPAGDTGSANLPSGGSKPAQSTSYNPQGNIATLSQLPWWQKLDSGALTLLGTVLFVSFSMTGVGLVMLYRHPAKLPRE